MAKDNLGLFAPLSLLLSFVMVAAGYEQWTAVPGPLHFIHFWIYVVPVLAERFRTRAGAHLCLWYQLESSGILEVWIFFGTALEHCLPTNVN